MSNLIAHAERELREAGLFDKDSDYEGKLGHAVMELVRVFAKQGHSGFSARQVIRIFSSVANYELLNPLKNPIETGEYMDVGSYLQSTRRHSVFSADGGKTWYDIDKRPSWWRRLLGQRRVYIKFESQR
jgi:hypothetical protein